MNEETIANVVGWGKTLGCIASSITVNLPDPGHIHRGAGKHGARHTVFRAGEVHGRSTPRVEEVCRLVGTADSAMVTPNQGGERWSKLVANVMGNGLSACTGLPGAQMLQSEPIRRFGVRLGSEAIRVGQAQGYRLEEILHLPPETIARAGEGDPAAMKAYEEQRFKDSKHTAAEQRPSGKRVPRGGRAPGRTTGRTTSRTTGHPTPRLPAVRRGPVPIPALVGALVLLLGLAVFFAVENAQVRGTPSAQNTALVDIGTTAEVSQQVTAALKTVYSFDYTRLDQNEAAARAVITPGFAGQFDQLFRQVRELAPQQQAVVTATVNLVGVQAIDGDTATLLVFLDQLATRAQAGAGPQQLAAAGRLTMTAQRVDGTWKIAAVDPR